MAVFSWWFPGFSLFAVGGIPSSTSVHPPSKPSASPKSSCGASSVRIVLFLWVSLVVPSLSLCTLSRTRGWIAALATEVFFASADRAVGLVGKALKTWGIPPISPGSSSSEDDVCLSGRRAAALARATLFLSLFLRRRSLGSSLVVFRFFAGGPWGLPPSSSTSSIFNTLLGFYLQVAAKAGVPRCLTAALAVCLLFLPVFPFRQLTFLFL